jgi:hypothetical protein
MMRIAPYDGAIKEPLALRGFWRAEGSAVTSTCQLGKSENRRLRPHAENSGRVCRGIELDPLYVDVIIRRYEAATGAVVILADSGETFEKVAARRRNDESDERD